MLNLRIIRTQADYNRAIERLSDLMTLDPPPQSPEAEELELAALVIAAYESKIAEPPALDPIEAIRFRIEQAGLTTRDLAQFIGSEAKVKEILPGKMELTLVMIRNPHRGLGIPAESLIAEQGREAPDPRQNGYA